MTSPGEKEMSNSASLLHSQANSGDRVSEDCGRLAFLLDGAVARQCARYAADVDLVEAARVHAEYCGSAGGEVSDGVDDAEPGSDLDSEVDDLDRGEHVLGGSHDIGRQDAGALELRADHEHDLHLDQRSDETGAADRGGFGQEHVVGHGAEVGLAGSGHLLHRLGGEPDLVALDACAFPRGAGR